MLHPWIDSCTETNFRRFFEVFVCLFLLTASPLSYFANPAALDASGLFRLTPHPYFSPPPSIPAKRSGPYAPPRCSRYHSELLIPWWIRIHLSCSVLSKESKYTPRLGKGMGEKGVDAERGLLGYGIRYVSESLPRG